MYTTATPTAQDLTNLAVKVNAEARKRANLQRTRVCEYGGEQCRILVAKREYLYLETSIGNLQVTWAEVGYCTEAR